MKTKSGDVQGYNAQAVATEQQIVVAAEVTDEHTDYHQLHPMIVAANQTLDAVGIDAPVGQLLADAGYCSEDNLAALVSDAARRAGLPMTHAHRLRHTTASLAKVRGIASDASFDGFGDRVVARDLEFGESFVAWRPGQRHAS